MCLSPLRTYFKLSKRNQQDTHRMIETFDKLVLKKKKIRLRILQKLMPLLVQVPLPCQAVLRVRLTSGSETHCKSICLRRETWQQKETHTKNKQTSKPANKQSSKQASKQTNLQASQQQKNDCKQKPVLRSEVGRNNAKDATGTDCIIGVVS